MEQLLQSWPDTVDTKERTRRLIDLFLVSVLLDAGAGTRWSYTSRESGQAFGRSEGLAVASLEMFKSGGFSSNPSQPFQVDAAGLKGMTVETLAEGMQVSQSNPMAGLEGRAGLLMRLSEALSNQDIFGADGRPGNMIGKSNCQLRGHSIAAVVAGVRLLPERANSKSAAWVPCHNGLTTADYLLRHPTTTVSTAPIVSLTTLWSVLMDGLSSIWPATRTQINGVSLGDAWPCALMPSSPPAQPWEEIVPFHKLTQWLCYSLMVPMSKLLNVGFLGGEMMTGLPEYRNGGLLVDTGLLTLKSKEHDRGIAAYTSHADYKDTPAAEVVPLFEPADDVIVEWRAVTVGFLDELLAEVNKSLGLAGSEALSLAQMLEAGTWKASSSATPDGDCRVRCCWVRNFVPVLDTRTAICLWREQTY